LKAADPKASPATALALVLIAVVVAGCGNAAAENDSAQPVGDLVGGSAAALAQCRDWNVGTEAEKRATIADIRSFVTPQSQEQSGTSLSDERAYRLFERSCSVDWAQGFKLYKLYVRAAAFAPLTQP
jgi:hypothetical protein